jgi:membrane fusion protein, peptide pheromone/bacteriocin exporter
MQQQVFPPEVLENSVETYLPQVTVKSQLIYSTLLAMLVLLLALLPVIKVDVPVPGNGEISTAFGRHEIRSQISGVLQEVNVRDNQLVKKGDLLFVVTKQAIETKQTITQDQKEQIEVNLNDLKELVANYQSARPAGALYQQQQDNLKMELSFKLSELQTAAKNLSTFRQLYREKAATAKELEGVQAEYNRIIAEKNNVLNRYLSQWQQELNQFRTQLGNLQMQQQQISEEKELYSVRSPLTGSIQMISGKTAGNYVQVGEQLAILSPDTTLLAECLLNPRDIGLIRKDMPVNFQVDAFNYNEWGLIQGSVVDISNDFVMIQNQPLFRVRCKLNSTELKLKSGFTGKLKKGMTVRAVFVVARRSLMQLLYDNVDDWLNPVKDTRPKS